MKPIDSISGKQAPVQKAWRDDPRRVAKIMREIFPNRADRDFVLTQLAESIREANTVAPKAWAVTLFPYGFRLNVAAVEVLTAFYGQVRLLIHCTDADIPVALRDGSTQLAPYKSVPGPNYIFEGTVEKFRQYRDVLIPAHYDIIAKACWTKKRKPVAGTRHQASHSRGLVELARSIAGKKRV